MNRKTKKQKRCFSRRKYLKDVKKRGLWAANIKLLKSRNKKNKTYKKVIKK